ncbi:Uncharacterized conserved protein [Dyella jiangningensis]|uniref:SphA family protein n=1 Tax=Dyella sp. AtDHG13 TaxID=1938897 RepID=UPI00088F2E1C|nr:transporter [Dyella sp. AtDHG13]PXV59061.1 hypothetical protein BDW41_104105 [Dyella sp. AtDHG13]SDL27756.1 Uncharacterized conserved protein [Dyella jiangningensis]
MECHRRYSAGIAAILLMLAGMSPAIHATEGGGGLYLLGSQSLDAGLTPAPGWYVTLVMLHYAGDAGGASLGGVKLMSLNKRTDSAGINLLYAPRQRVLGGQLAVSITAPYAHLKLSGEISAPRGVISRSVSGSGSADTAMSARLGWAVGPSFTHAVAITVWAPTGTYNKGFTPSLGHNRWAGDALWAFTYAPFGHHTEFSAAIGYGVNAPNDVTHYRSGNEAHLELAIGQHLSPHWEVGLAGYAYRQVSGDNGPGALLGTLKGRVYGAGPAVNYGTRLGTHVVAFTARYYREFGAEHHFEGDLVLASATIRF